MITHIGGHELSRSTVLSMVASDAQDTREQRAREEYAAEQREQAAERAQAYYREFGEWEWQTRAREAEVAARAEAVREEKRRIERAERHQAHMAGLLAAGQRPRSISEVLEIAAMLP